VLCGRDTEISRITRLLEEARHGRSGVLILYGEAGIGKTALLDHARESAADLRALTVRGSEPEQNLAFAGLAQVVHPAADWIGQLPEPQARALAGAVALGPAEATDRFAVYAATLGLLAQLAEELPLLLIIDDAHWLDIPSAEAFGFVARRLVAEGIAMLVATRDLDAVWPSARQLPSCLVSGLDSGGVTELIQLRTGISAQPAVVSRLTEGTGGNPMALLETLDKLSPAQLTGGQSFPDLVPAVVAAGALFARRVAALSDAARTALLLLATAASTRIQPVLEAAEILSIPETAFAEVETAGLAAVEAGAFSFSHPLVRAAAVASAQPAQRRAAHRVLAAVLTDDRYVEERTWHLAEATLGPDERVAAALEAMAGTARARSGYAAAVSALERAAALSAERPARARRLYTAAGDAHLAGHSGQARELLRAAEKLANDAPLRMAVAAVRGRVEAFTGHPAPAHRILREAAKAIEDIDPHRCAELLTDAAMAALLAGEAMAGVEDAARATQLAADPTGNVALVSKVFQGLILLHVGQAAEASRLLAESFVIAGRTGADRPAVEYVIAAGLGMTWIGEHIAARHMLAPIVQELRTAGALGMLPFALGVDSRAEMLAGNLVVARSTAAEAVELSRTTGDEFWQYIALSALAHVQAIRGDERDCRANAGAALALRREGTDYPRDASEALGLLELGLGRYEEAIAAFRAGVQITALGTEGAEESHTDLVEAHLRSGRQPTPHMATILDQLAADSQVPISGAVAWRLRGLTADADFSDCFHTSLELHAKVDCPFETGRTQLAFGERLRRAGDRVHARTQLRAALEVFERLAAHPWAERARNELTATGETIRKRATASALDDLTPQEYQVARAVAAGRTNKEVASALFLSAKTVEFHLGNVYRKLGVRGRTELAHGFPELAGR